MQLRYRCHARLEDHIRAAEDTAMRATLPFHNINLNRIWLAITAIAVELLAGPRGSRAEWMRLALASQRIPA